MAEKLKALKQENRELRQANEILRKASAYFAAPPRPTMPMWPNGSIPPTVGPRQAGCHAEDRGSARIR
jgi:hypothetical protein